MHAEIIMIKWCGIVFMVLASLAGIISTFTGCEDSPLIQDQESLSLAPGVSPSDTSTTVWAYWGGTVYHKDTCRFIVGSKKVKELLFCFSCERVTKMGLKACSSCFKVVK